MFWLKEDTRRLVTRNLLEDLSFRARVDVNDLILDYNEVTEEGSGVYYKEEF